jgi:hypothetical protein
LSHHRADASTLHHVFIADKILVRKETDIRKFTIGDSWPDIFPVEKNFLRELYFLFCEEKNFFTQETP